jgi:hypothetical protein
MMVITFLTGANRDFSNWRRQSMYSLEPTHKDQEPTRSKELQKLTAASAPTYAFVDAAQEISRILADTKRAGLSQLVGPVATAQKTDAQSAASYRRQHVCCRQAAPWAWRSRLDPFSADFDPGLAKQLVGEQAPAHADLAMDAPDR